MVVTNNINTRQSLAEQLGSPTDNKLRVLRTVLLNDVDVVNQPALRKENKRTKESERGTWFHVML